MFERISRAAENMATRVSMSRRGFFGRLGKAALSAAAVAGSLLALSNRAQAGSQKLYYCHYQDKPNCSPHLCSFYYSGQYCGGCPAFSCCWVTEKTLVGTC